MGDARLREHRREHLDADHPSGLTNRAETRPQFLPRIFASPRSCTAPGGNRWHGQQHPAERQPLLADAVGQKAEVANLHKPGGQHVLQKLGLRSDGIPHEHSGRNQPSAERLRARHSGFWLLISGFHIPQGYQGEALAS